MNVQQQLTTAMVWPTVTTMKVPSPASVGKTTRVMEYQFVLPYQVSDRLLSYVRVVTACQYSDENITLVYLL